MGVAKHPLLVQAVQAQRRVDARQELLSEARAQLYEAVRKAIAGGITLSALGRELGMSRQNVQRLARRH